MRKRRLLLAAGLIAGGALVIAVEIVAALSKDFIKDDPEPVKGRFGNPAHPRLRFAVLGDSTTVGLGASPHESFPWLLAERLSGEFYVELEVLGTSGAKTQDVAHRQVLRALDLAPDLVLVEIGANDATHVTPIRTVRRKMGEALDALAKSGIQVVVAGPPAMGTSRAFAQPLRALSGLNGVRVKKAIQKEAESRGVPFIDVASATRAAFEDNPEKYYSTDMFHPGAKGYELYADAMYPVLLKTAQALPGLRPLPPANNRPPGR